MSSRGPNRNGIRKQRNKSIAKRHFNWSKNQS